MRGSSHLESETHVAGAAAPLHVHHQLRHHLRARLRLGQGVAGHLGQED